jgi:hypothetical protein
MDDGGGAGHLIQIASKLEKCSRLLRAYSFWYPLLSHSPLILCESSCQRPDMGEASDQGRQIRQAAHPMECAELLRQLAVLLTVLVTIVLLFGHTDAHTQVRRRKCILPTPRPPFPLTNL